MKGHSARSTDSDVRREAGFGAEGAGGSGRADITEA
jgi:hypothetical protein